MPIEHCGSIKELTRHFRRGEKRATADTPILGRFVKRLAFDSEMLLFWQENLNAHDEIHGYPILGFSCVKHEPIS